MDNQRIQVDAGWCYLMSDDTHGCLHLSQSLYLPTLTPSRDLQKVNQQATRIWRYLKLVFFYSLAESPRHPCEMCRRRWKSRFVNPLASVQLTWPDLAPLFRPTLEGAWSGGQSARAGLAFDSGRTYGGHIEKTPQLWLKGWSNVEYHQMDFFGCVNG